MTARQGRSRRRRRRRAWKAAGVTLLVLMSGSLGCQGTGGVPASGARNDPTGTPSLPIRPTSTAAVYPDLTKSDAVQVAAPANEQASAAVKFGKLSLTDDGKSGEPSRTASAGTSGEPSRTESTSGEPSRTPSAARQAAPTAPSEQPLIMTAAQKTGAEQPAAPRQLPIAEQPIAVEQKTTDKKDRPKKEVKEYQVDRTLPSPVAGMTTPIIPPPDKVYPITLGAALALAGVQNPVIGLADQEVRISRARQLQARILLVPSINVGANYNYHDGPLQASFGGIRKVTRNDVYYGLGANTVAAETLKIPGILLSAHLGDAIYLPLAARQVVANRRFAFRATRNQILLDVSQRYLDLLWAEGRLAVIRQSEKDFDEAFRLTTEHFKSGLSSNADADRAKTDLLGVQTLEVEAQAKVFKAAADLAELLNLDPSVRLQTGDVPIKVVEFFDPKEPLPKLLQIALNNRPELGAASANIAASQVRLRQEKVRIFYPLIIMGFSAGDFGGGAVASTNGNVFNPHTGGTPFAATPASGGRTIPAFGHIAGRTDFDVLALWTLRNFGWGNLALIRERREQLGQAQAERLRVMNQVALEVAEAYNLSAARLMQIEGARQEVIQATEGFQTDLKRIMARARARPIELLNNAQLLMQGRLRLLQAIIDYDVAQFKLFVALGQPPTLALAEEPPAGH